MKRAHHHNKEPLTLLLERNARIGTALLVLLVMLALLNLRPDHRHQGRPALGQWLVLPILLDIEDTSIHWSK